MYYICIIISHTLMSKKSFLTKKKTNMCFEIKNLKLCLLFYLEQEINCVTIERAQKLWIRYLIFFQSKKFIKRFYWSKKKKIQTKRKYNINKYSYLVIYKKLIIKITELKINSPVISVIAFALPRNNLGITFFLCELISYFHLFLLRLS